MTLANGKEYSRDYFIKSKDATWYEELYVRCTFPFHIPKLIMNTFFMTADVNFLTKRKDKMNGQICVSTSKQFDLSKLKSLSKAIKVSINDIVTASITTAFKQIFKEHNDESTHVNLIIPASVRFKFYPTKESVKLENKFAAMCLRVPLTDSMTTAYAQI